MLAAVHSLSGLFWAVSVVEPSLFCPLPPLSPSLISHLASVDIKQNGLNGLILFPCIYIYANCDHSFPIHTDLKIQVPTVENLALSDVLHLRPGVGDNVAMHVYPSIFLP